MDYSTISRLLKSSDYVVKKDTALFRKWEEGDVTLNECYNQFLKNNGYRKHKYTGEFNTPWYVDKITFKRWLHSLGYVRIKNDEEGDSDEE